MSTRSTIGILNSDGSVDHIYCHYDGYPDHNGIILKESYTTEEKVRHLIALGSISSLGPSIGSKHDFNDPPDDDECNVYGRDRGEEGTDFKHSPNMNEYLRIYAEEYNYLFHPSSQVWYMCRAGEDWELLY